MAGTTFQKIASGNDVIDRIQDNIRAAIEQLDRATTLIGQSVPGLDDAEIVDGQTRAFWRAQTAWFIDPGGASGGNDANRGLDEGTPIRTTAVWRRRCIGYLTAASVTVTMLSGSTNPSDGCFSGVRAAPGTAFNVVMRPVVVGTGTFTAVTPISGNARGTVADTAIATSWTAGNGTSTYVSVAGAPRMIRNAARTKHSWVLTDQGAKTASIYQPTDASETSGASNATANFTVGEAYEVCSLPSLAGLEVDASSGLAVQFRGGQTSGTLAAVGMTFTPVLASFSACSFPDQPYQVGHLNCFLSGTTQFLGPNFGAWSTYFNASVRFNRSVGNNGTTNCLQAGGTICNGTVGILGSWHTWDVSAGRLFSLQFGSAAVVTAVAGALTGTAAIATVVNSVLVLQNPVAATVVAASPYVAGGTASATSPVSEAASGSFIYGTSP